MSAAPPPIDEAARVRALETYDILDTPAEPAFDRIAGMASRLLGTPAALVSLVDPTRQWFKAAIGIDARETPREHAFCAYAILDDRVMVVPDATKDPRFRTNPLVTGPPHIRFYAGAPLTVPGDHRLGTLCVIGPEPRELGEAERKILCDLAEMAVSELELRRRVKEAEQRSERLAKLQKQLFRKNTELERFAYSASHDIQQPLRIMDGFLELLQADYGDKLDEQGREYVRYAQDAAQRLAALTEHLLVYARASRPMTHSDRVSLDAVMHTVVRDVADGVRSTGGRVTIGRLPEVWGSVPRLYQLLVNLVRNGLKFHRPGVPPEVHVSATRVDSAWEVHVCDNGIGIPAAMHERVFTPFERLHAVTDFEGSGLGLATAKRVAEQHGGSIRIESDGQSGTCFVVTLPDRG